MHGTHARFLPSSAGRPILSDSASSDKRPLAWQNGKMHDLGPRPGRHATGAPL